MRMRKPSPAMAVAIAALVLSVGGNVTAAVLVRSADIADDTIRSVDVHDGTIKSEDVGTGQITGGDVDEASLGRVPRAAQATSADEALKAGDARLLDGRTASDFVVDSDTAGGDLTGRFDDLQIAPRTVTRDNLWSGAGQGCCVISFFEFTVPANSCHTRPIGFPDADVGEIFVVHPERGEDLGAGVYLRPTVVAHQGEAVIETCNGNATAITVEFNTFFNVRLIG